MCFAVVKTEVECTLVESKCAAIVVVVTFCQLVHHGVIASASYRFSQYS